MSNPKGSTASEHHALETTLESAQTLFDRLVGARDRINNMDERMHGAQDGAEKGAEVAPTPIGMLARINSTQRDSLAVCDEIESAIARLESSI